MKRPTLVLSILLVALGLYIYFYERDPVVEESGARLVELPQPEIDTESIVSIVLDGSGRERVELESTESGGWLLRQPTEAPADPSEVDTLIENIETIRFERVIARAVEGELGDYGLTSPETSVEIETRDGSRHGFMLGATTPTGDNRYARALESEDIVTVSAGLFGNFNLSHWDLRDKRVFRRPNAGPDDVESLTIERTSSPGGAFTLSRNGTTWSLVQNGSETLADRYTASSLASNILGATMTRVVSENPTPGEVSEHGLDPASRRVHVSTRDGESSTLNVGLELSSGYAARRDGESTIFELETSLVADEIDREIDTLLSKKLTEVSVLEIRRVEITRGAQLSVAAKGESNDAGEESWRLLEPGERPLLTRTVEDFLYRLNGVRVDSLSTPTEAMNGEPLARFELFGGEDTGSQWIRFWEAGGEIRAIRNREDYALDIPRELWEELDRLSRFPDPEPTGDDSSQSPGS